MNIATTSPAGSDIIQSTSARADCPGDLPDIQLDNSTAIKNVCEGYICIGTVFRLLEAAKKDCEKFACVRLYQMSTKKSKFVTLCCFRAGTHLKKDSTVTKEFQRNRETKKCNRPFLIKLRQGTDDTFEVYEIRNEHNHEMLDDTEVATLAQNRFIPDDVQLIMMELNSLGVLSCSKIMTLIEKKHFPNTSKTWTTRDVQNLFQSMTNRSCEANEFVKLLDQKSAQGWTTYIHLNEDTMRLERICWLSETGKKVYQQFNDVLEIDATYKTNRFGMPLILFTVVDNNGLTILLGGCLVSNERYEFYVWTLEKFQSCVRRPPIVVFTDGDTELMRAIRAILPESTHLLCRFHIAQNIARALAGTLKSELNEFLDDFWRVGSIETLSNYQREFDAMKEKWPQAISYLNILQAKQEKWAFAYTHSHFVAGVSSTQRQEMIN